MSETETYDTTGVGKGKKSGRDASTEAIIEAIERPEKKDLNPIYNPDASGMLPTFELPGFGETQEDCGDPIDFFCDCCFRMVELGRTCNQSTCKRCASTWCRNRAENSVAYLKALRFKRYAETGRDQYWHHVVLSPPSDWELSATNPYERTWAVVKEILDELSLRGYVGYHPWSGDDDVEDDRGEWKDRLFEGRDWDDDVKQELKARPHFHAVGVADFVKGGELTKRVEEETGWVITRITKRDSKRSIDGIEDLAKVTSYVISHTGLKETAAGNYSAQWRNIGFRESDVDVFEDTRKEARKVVRKVASKTLGIPSADMRCEVQVPKGKDAPPESEGADDLLQEGNGADGDGSSEPGADSVEVEPCEGSMLIITKAPKYIHDRRLEHPRIPEVQERYEYWKEQEDWIG